MDGVNILDLLWQRANLPAPPLPLLAPAAVAAAVIVVVVVVVVIIYA